MTAAILVVLAILALVTTLIAGAKTIRGTGSMSFAYQPHKFQNKHHSWLRFVAQVPYI